MARNMPALVDGEATVHGVGHPKRHSANAQLPQALPSVVKLYAGSEVRSQQGFTPSEFLHRFNLHTYIRRAVPAS